jgi:hypothetical protein
MSSNPRPDDHAIDSPSRLSFYKGCNTPINTELWARHLATLRTLERQASALGLWEIAYEFSLLIAGHISAQLS